MAVGIVRIGGCSSKSVRLRQNITLCVIGVDGRLAKFIGDDLAFGVKIVCEFGTFPAAFHGCRKPAGFVVFIVGHNGAIAVGHAGAIMVGIRKTGRIAPRRPKYPNKRVRCVQFDKNVLY